MRSTMLGFLAETSIHHGAGRSSGIVDLPIAREAATDYPFIAGSSLKGALRDRARGLSHKNVSGMFGEQDHAGALIVSDARLLLLPVRSLNGAYRWLTCPLLLERYRRDLARCGLLRTLPVVQVPKGEGAASALGARDSGGSSTLYLEEREFSLVGECPSAVHDALAALIRHEDTRARIPKYVVVIADDDFAWFCRYAMPIQARNHLKEETKVSDNLWYEESLPPDTVLYSLTMSRDEDARNSLGELFPEGDPYLQIGGNETVGQGWIVVTIQSAAMAENGGAK